MPFGVLKRIKSTLKIPHSLCIFLPVWIIRMKTSNMTIGIKILRVIGEQMCLIAQAINSITKLVVFFHYLILQFIKVFHLFLKYKVFYLFIQIVISNCIFYCIYIFYHFIHFIIVFINFTVN